MMYNFYFWVGGEENLEVEKEERRKKYVEVSLSFGFMRVVINIFKYLFLKFCVVVWILLWVIVYSREVVGKW